MRTAPPSRFPPLVTGSMAMSLAVSAGLWLGLYFLLPPIPGMADDAARLGFAIKCCCVAVLLCLLAGIEAVSHERLQTDAFDPLGGYESPRMKINLRYLQNTLEQTILFVVGLLGLAIYCPDGNAMRAVVATTAVWTLSRYAFWLGYHQGPLWRVLGLVGMPQSMLVLLYVSSRFGYEFGGIAGAVVPLAIFGFIEIVLVMKTRDRAQ